MRSIRKTILVPLLSVAVFVIGLRLLPAQEAADPSIVDSVATADSLALTQEQLADKYKRLEMLMLKMAEVDAAENPQRSALLKKAIAQSKNKFIKKNMDDLVKVLQEQRYRNAIEGQSTVRNDLKLLLELLQSENRTDRIKSEQDRVRQYIRELQRIIRQQKSVQGRTESGEDGNRVADDQKKVADRADRLAKTIAENESTPGDESADDGSNDESTDDESDGDGPPEDSDSFDSDSDSDTDHDPDTKSENGDSDSSDGKADDKPNDGQPNDDQPSENEGSDAKPTDGENGSPDSEPSNGDSESDGKPNNQDAEQSEGGKPSEGSKPSESGKPSDSESQGSPQEGQPSQPGQPQQGDQSPDGQPGSESPNDSNQQQPQQQDDSFPGRKRIAAAEEKMQDAAKKLKEAEREGAIEDQEDARRLLEQAKAELEEILRQLREEEIERTLAQLESRFRKMLAMQIAVYDDTKQLAKVPAANRNKSFDIQASKQSLAERRIVEEADRTILLLLEEGSSVAFPEATQQMRNDMEDVAERLAESKIGEMTIGLEEDIINSLEEMIAALQQAQKDAEEQKQRQQQQQQQQGPPEDQPLVNAIEELKMIRALQMRVNKRTVLYAKMLADDEDLIGQATDPDLIESLERLAGREERIRKITRDIVTGKTQ
jgi:hypothetical protein